MRKLSRAWNRFRALPAVVHAIIVLVLVFVASRALAQDLIVTNPETGDQLRLLDRPCRHAETLGHLRPEWRPKFKDGRIVAADGTIQIYFCWIRHDSERLYLKFQDDTSFFLKIIPVTAPPADERAPT